MGFRTAAVVTTTCFLLGWLPLSHFGQQTGVSYDVSFAGVLLIGLASADFPILYSQKSTAADLDRAERYYLTLFNAPGAIPALLHAMVGSAIRYRT